MPACDPVRKDSDPDAAKWEAAEKRLVEWGRCCQRNAEIAGMPTMSLLVEIIAHVRRQEKDRRKERKKKIRELVRGKRERDEPVDAKEIAELKGYIEPELTAKGKQSKGGPKPSISLDSRAAEVDYIVSRQPKWVQKVLIRSYRYFQSDEKASAEMDMRQGEYAQRRRRAVQNVADWLEIRYIHRHAPRRGSV